ncbi:EAL domain-containing protein [Candidatus Methylospira mobilis]|uniref:EAL domain-containing protein n=1 Tax=Candidatus Methylospira mobilis TaxID=1808979 RepID=A0A5Q0BF93_9GAMM|nr:EAL domain-containing protein [Candidatus Methylospira mobilis]QFY41802.1 EAL domain-containing protein [Candidatus Methylospira mobilis]WNV06666.1 EAL domain-containing protein [Candidatus Methylospira mobilis]
MMQNNRAGIGLWERNLIDGTLVWSNSASNLVKLPNNKAFPAKHHAKWEDFLALIHPEDRQYLENISRAHIKSGSRFEAKCRVHVVDDTFRLMRVAAQLERDGNGAPVYIRGIIENVAESGHDQREPQLVNSVFAHIKEGILVTDGKGIILDASPAFTRLTGYSREEVLGKTPRLLQSGRYNDEFYEHLWKTLLEQGAWSGEIVDCKKDGSIFQAWLSISAVDHKAGKTTRYVAIFSDVSPLKQQTDKLEQLAYYDPLTQIPNRLLLADRMHQAVAQTRRQNCLLAVGYLDLDAFKPINDQYGHEMGDRLLIEVSQRISKAIREVDTVARLGGDEFAFLLLGLENIDQCASTLQRMLDCIARPFSLNENTVEVSASIGATLFPEDDADADTLLRHADQAMYQAKQSGKNRFQIYDSELELNRRTHGEVLNRIQYALENGELVLYYQPIISLQTSEFASVEALLRWQHPDCGLVLPSDFLPLLQNQTLAQTVDRWVMEKAMQQLIDWAGQGLNIAVSVNLSVHTLQSEDFIGFFSSLLQRYPTVKPERYQLEILGTTALPLEDIDFISRTMRECVKLGVSFALDDFGTGYSSLTYLKHLPAQIIKIDRSFVCDMLKEEESLAIVKSVIGLAHAFRRQTVAEGVETLALGAQLLQLGCDQAQGNGISEALPAAKLPDWIKNWKAPNEWVGPVEAGHNAPLNVRRSNVNRSRQK